MSKIRDSLWNYPETVSNLYNRTKPLSIIMLVFFLISSLFYLFSVPRLLSQPVRSSADNTFTEAVVGEATTYNPIFNTGSDIERTIFDLTYTKLIYIEEGSPTAGVAYNWELLEDGKTIRFELDPNTYWHDGERLDADDVVFTVSLAQKMAARGYDTFGSVLSGVKVKAESENVVLFTFDEIIAGVYETLSFYVVPEHVMRDLSDEQLSNYGKLFLPVGSGRYKIIGVTPSELRMVDSDEDYKDMAVNNFNILFFDDKKSLEVAFRNNLIDAIGNLTPENLDFIKEYDQYKSYEINIPQRKKVIFTNMRLDKLKNDNIRYAVARAIDKEKLTRDYSGAANSTNSTIPSSSWAYANDLNYFTYSIEEARKSLTAAGFTFDEEAKTFKDGSGNELTLDLTYMDTLENDEVADRLIEMYDNVGLKVIPKPVGYERLINEVLATRSFELLLLELEVRADPDQYNLWHSTQVDYPNLNISGYEYGRLDVLLQEARVETNQKLRADTYRQIQRFLALDLPVVTLFEPKYKYVVNDRFKNVNLEEAAFPSERHHNIENWEIE